MSNANQPQQAQHEWLHKLAEAQQQGDVTSVLLMSRQLLNADIQHDKDNNDLLTIYVEALQKIRKQHLQEAEELSASQQYRRALNILRGDQITDPDLALVQQIRAALLDDETTTTQIKKLELLAEGSASGSEHSMNNSDGSDAVAVNNADHAQNSNVREQEITREIQQLQEQANSFLRQQTRQNYKQAIACYDQILGFELPTDERRRYEKRRTEIEQQYEEFRTTRGELTTAIASAEAVAKLIASRRLLNQDVEEAEDGSNLLEIYTQALQEVRMVHLRQANEQVTFAQNDIALAIDMLENGLIEAAEQRYRDALGVLRGERIEDKEKRDNALVQQIRNSLLDDETTTKRINEINKYLEDLKTRALRLRQVYQAYTSAEQAYSSREFARAIEELEKLRAHIDADFQSRLIDNLRERVVRSWENVTAAELDARLASIRAAIARHDDPRSIDEAINVALRFEPDLKTDRIEELRAKIRGTLDEAQQQQQRLNQMLDAATRDRGAGKFEDAEQQVRTILVQFPANDRAKTLLSSIITDQVRRAMRDAEATLVAPQIDTLKASLDHLTGVETKIADLDGSEQRRMRESCNQLRDQLERRLTKLQQQEQARQQASQLMNQAAGYAQNGEFSTACNLLQQARETAPALSGDIDERLSLIRSDWRSTLKRSLRAVLDMDQPDLTLAQDYLNMLQQEQLEDSETATLRRQVEQFVQREQAERHFAQGEYEQALAIFSQLDLTDPNTQRKYQESRRAEARRQVENRNWRDALAMLEKFPQSDSEVRLWMSQCRGEMALAGAEALLQQKNFGGSRQQIAAAEQEIFGDIRERAVKLRSQLDSMEETFNRAKSLDEQAQQYYGAYSTTGDRTRLKEAIQLLDEALALPSLAAGDEQRIEVQTRRNAYVGIYEQQTSTERQRILEAAEQALRSETLDGIEQAYQYYAEVLALNPQQNDPDGLRGQDRVRTVLRTLRNQIVKQIHQLLNIGGSNQRGMYPNDLTLLIQKAERAQRQPQIEPQPHTELGEALQELQVARHLCDLAERDLQSARTRWSQERARGGNDFHPIELDLERAREHFLRRPYIHIELDNSSPESLTARIKADQKSRNTVSRTAQEIEGLLQNEPSMSLQNLFRTLLEAEEDVYKTSIWIAEQTNQPRPQSNRERYPQQYRILSRIADDIQSLRLQEEETVTIAGMREYRSKYEVLENLLARLDPDNRFELREARSKVDLDDRQLEQVEQSLKDGQQALNEAHEAEDVASKAKAAKAWRQGVEAYQLSRTQYVKSIELLKPIPTMLSETSIYQALNIARNNASSMLQSSEQSLQQLDAIQPWREYEKYIQSAREALDTAKQALKDGDFAQARAQAHIAKEQDPALGEDADRVIRDADALQDEGTNVTGWIVLGVLALALLGAGILFGPGAYNWLVSFFFPAGASPIYPFVVLVIGLC